MSESTIESVSESVLQWRKAGGKRLPAAVWEEIFSLRSRHSWVEISRATGIKKQYLGKKFSKRRAGFVEVKMAESERLASVTSKLTNIEVRRPDGIEIRLQISISEAGAFVRGILQ
jgi:hypothetical protein